MNTPQRPHPPAQRLKEFGLGRLGDTESSEIEAHLSTCSECQQIVAEAPADSLVALLQEPAPHVVDQAPESRPGLLKRLAAIVNPQPAQPSLQPAPRPVPRPAPRPHRDVPVELQNHPRYEVLEHLGAGGMGTVFKARHRLMDRVVALKVMHPQLLAQPVAAERFAREVKAAAQLTHPHIVTAFDAEQVGSLHFLVMEYVEGQMLSELVDRGRSLPLDRACEYARQAALGLQAAHQRGMVHRDIKPQNLVLTPAEQVKVLDFGLARFVSESDESGTGTAFGKLLGSPDYMAPEQAKDAHSADIRADIYSLGCTLYYLLSGAPPFPGGSAAEKISAHLDKTPLPIRKIRPEVPDALSGILGRLLAKDPQQRFQTPGEVATALEPFCQPAPAEQPARRVTTALRQCLAWARPRRNSLAPVLRGEGWGEGPQSVPRRRSSVGAWAAAVALLLALGFGGFFYGAAIYRLVTNQGTLVIETDDRDVEVIVKQGGEQVQIVDTKTGREVTLKAGEYQLELGGGKPGLKLSTNQFTLTRGGTEIAKVWLETQEPGGQVKVEPAPRNEPPVAVQPSEEPPPLKDYLRGHEVLTVAQDGSGKYRSLNDAFQTLSAGQVIKVLDRGPYRERLEGPVPANVGIVSEAGTRIEVPDWKQVSTGAGDKRYAGWSLINPEGFRISGLEFHFPQPPADLDNGDLLAALNVEDARESLTIDACQFRHAYGFDASDEFSERPYWFFGLRLCSAFDCEITVANNRIDGLLYVSCSLLKSLRIERNHVVARGGYGVSVYGSARQLVMTHNVVTHCQNAAYFTALHRPIADKDDRPTAQISNNIFLATHGAIWFGRPTADSDWFFSPAVRIKNNLFLRPNVGISLDPQDVDAVSNTWQVGQNCYPTAPEAGGPSPIRFPRQPTDLLVPEVKFLSTNPNDTNYLRIPADSPLSTGGAGGDLPTYLGALPPGPAPKAGDWFTRLRPLAAGSQVATQGTASPGPAPEQPDAKPRPKQPAIAAISLIDVRRFIGHRRPINGVSVSADGRSILSGSDDKTARLWDVGSGREVRRLDHTEPVAAVAFAPSGKKVLTASGNLIRLWDVTAGTELGQFAGHTGPVQCVAFSADGRYIVSGSQDTTVRVWEVEGRREHRLLAGHEKAVTGVAMTRDGSEVLSGSLDGTLQFWNVETGGKPRRVGTHQSGVRGAALSPDGVSALSGGDDLTLRWWDVTTGEPRLSFSRRSIRSTAAENALAFSGRLSSPLACLALSPDGSRAISGDGSRTARGFGGPGQPAVRPDYRVHVWDVASGQESGRSEDCGDALSSVAFSGDGRFAVAAGRDKAVRLLWLTPSIPPGKSEPSELPKNQSLLVLEKDAAQVPLIVKQAGRLVTVLSAKISPSSLLKPGAYDLELSDQADEFRLAADKLTLKAGAKQTVVIRRRSPSEKPAPAQLTELRRFSGHTAGVLNVAISSDGKLALSAGRDKTIRLWDVAGGQQVRSFEGVTEEPWGVAFSPDGSRALSGGMDKAVRLWDVTTGKETASFSGHTDGVFRVAFSPDGRWALSGGRDKTVRLWEVETRKQLRSFEGHESAVLAVAFSPDGHWAVSGSGNDATVRLWDVETGQEVRQFDGHTEAITSVAFSPDSRLALTGSADRTMRLWDVATGRQLRSLSHPTGVCCVAISPDGRLAVSGSGSKTTPDGGTAPAGHDYTVRLWDLASGQVLAQADGFTGAIDAAAFSPDGRSVLVGSNDATLRLLKLPEPSSLPITEVGRFSVPGQMSAVLSPDGRYGLSLNWHDPILRLWDVESRQQVQTFEGSSEAACLAFSPDGKWALSGSYGPIKNGAWAPGDNSIRLWEVATGKSVRRFLGHTAQLKGVAFTPDGRQILSASSDSTLRLWDVQTGRQLRVFQGHQGRVISVALSSDGRRVISGGDDKTARLWDVATGRELRRFEGHTEVVVSVALSPDGRWVLSGSHDKTMRLWEVESGRQVRLFSGHSLSEFVAFSPDGRRALSGSDGDQTTRLWDVATGQELGRFDGAFCVSSVGPRALALTDGGTRHVVLLKLPPADQETKPTVTGDIGQLVLDTEAADGWLLVKQRDQVVLVLDATANQQADLKPGEYQLELAGRTAGLRLSADKFTLAKDAKRGVQIRPESKPARVEIIELRRFVGHRSVNLCPAALSRDGRYVLSGVERDLRLWDVASGKEVRRFEGHMRPVSCVALSPDSRLALSASGRSANEPDPASDSDIRLWELATGKELGRLAGHKDGTGESAWSPDGRFVLCGNGDRISVWNVETRKLVRTFEGHWLRAAFSEDAQYVLAVAAWGKTAGLWNVATGTEVRRFEGHESAIWSLAFSPNGKQVLTGSLDRTMRLWDRETGQVLRSFSHPTGVRGVAFSPDGRRLLSGSGTRADNQFAMYDDRVRLWDAASGCELGSLGGLLPVPHQVSFSGDGRLGLLGGWDNNTARLLWFAETSSPNEPAGPQNAGQLAVETNGFDLPIMVKQPEKLVTVIVPKISKLVDLPPGEYELELVGQPEDFRLSADKVTLTKGQKQTVSILDVPVAKPPHEITELRRFEGHTAAIESVVFSPDGRRALSGSQDKTVRLWEVDTGKLVRQFEGNTQRVFGVAFSPDGRQALSAGSDEANRDFAIPLWNVDTGKEVRRFTGHTADVRMAVFSPDGSRCASCSIDGTVRLWDVKTGTELKKLTRHEAEVWRVAFTPDGRQVLSGGVDALLRLWDLETAQELRRFEGHTEKVVGAAFSPDGRQAVSCAADKTLRLWDVETGRQFRSFSGCRTSESLVTFSNDGRRILSGSGWRSGFGHAGFDYCVRLRDVATGEILGCFEGHTAPVVTVAFSPDGRTALSAGYDNTIRLLQLPEPDEEPGTPAQE